MDFYKVNIFYFMQLNICRNKYVKSAYKIYTLIIHKNTCMYRPRLGQLT